MIIKLVDTKDELLQILSLQNMNHVNNIPTETKNSNGFVTVKHDIDLLISMNKNARQIIAIDNDVLVGYALVMLKEFKEMIPVLIPMFKMLENLCYNSKKISDYNYYVMGQICVKDTHRGLGIFEKLYMKHKEIYSNQFDICLTEVSTSNKRSMKAHEKVGFKTIHCFEDKTDTWNILLWDWNTTN